MQRCLQTRLINVNERGESGPSPAAVSLQDAPLHVYDNYVKSLNKYTVL